MARWIIHRPHERCHASEIRVAEVLKDLDDRWTVLWGYFYQDDRRNDREGDFLALEAENTVSRWFSATGPWEGESGIVRTSKSKCKVETPARIL